MSAIYSYFTNPSRLIGALFPAPTNQDRINTLFSTLFKVQLVAMAALAVQLSVAALFLVPGLASLVGKTIITAGKLYILSSILLPIVKRCLFYYRDTPRVLTHLSRWLTDDAAAPLSPSEVEVIWQHLRTLSREECYNLLDLTAWEQVGRAEGGEERVQFLRGFSTHLVNMFLNPSPEVRHLFTATPNITTFPKAIGLLNNHLRVLNFFDTQVATLPPWLSTLTNLRTLACANNQLTEIPDWVGSFPSLRTLILSGNPGITQIPETIFNLPHSCIVYLHGTGLSTQAREAILQRTRDENYQGPTFTFTPSNLDIARLNALPDEGVADMD